MPFPTALLAQYIGTDYMKPAVVFYCFGGVVNSIGWNLLIHTVYKPKCLFYPNVNIEILDKTKRSIQLGLIVYAGSTILAFWLPVVALIINLLLWIVWITLSINEKD
jgi:hypothetical protein